MDRCAPRAAPSVSRVLFHSCDVQTVPRASDPGHPHVIPMRERPATDATCDARHPRPTRPAGISGPFDMVALAPKLVARGLSPRLLDALMCGDRAPCCPTTMLERVNKRTGTRQVAMAEPPYASATTTAGAAATAAAATAATAAAAAAEAAEAVAEVVAEAAVAPSAMAAPGSLATRTGSGLAPGGTDERWPPVTLFHGTEDRTVDCTQTRAFAARLRLAGVPYVRERYLAGKSHTDPIIEDPLLGADDPLLTELLCLVKDGEAALAAPPTLPTSGAAARAHAGEADVGAGVRFGLRLVRWVNPF